VLDFKDKNIAIISVDPSKRKTGGALLGDRIRMNAINQPKSIYALIGNEAIQFALCQSMFRMQWI
jgi:hypothetical protein